MLTPLLLMRKNKEKAALEHKYIHFLIWENTKRNHVQSMYKRFVQDNILISRLYLIESGRSTQHHQIIHVSISSSAHPDKQDCNDTTPVCDDADGSRLLCCRVVSWIHNKLRQLNIKQL